MGSEGHPFRRFLTAEEVPRWFGLSIVLIYLVGLGSVAHLGIGQARRVAAAQFQVSSRYAVKMLAERLSAIVPAQTGLADADATDPALQGHLRPLLRDFVRHIPARWVRVVDRDGRVLASTGLQRPGEPSSQIDLASGARAAGGGSGMLDTRSAHASGRAPRDVLARAPITSHSVVDLTTDLAPPLPTESGPAKAASRVGGAAFYLEARLPPEPMRGSSIANHARLLATVLVLLGALFVVYRCLREQLRGVSRIADRLRRREQLDEDLSSLRIVDTLDSATVAWNELIDLMQRLRETVLRSEADEELSRALKHSNGGALAEALSAVPDGIVYVSDEVRFEYVNTSARRLLGWNDQDSKQATLPDATATGVGGKVLDLLRDAQQPDGGFEERAETLDTDGSGGSSYRVRVLPLHRGHHHGECIAVIRDVSQQIRAERAREEFITQVTHELRIPLTNIRAYAETLSSGMFDDPNVITECYNVITKETRRLSRLVEDVLSVSQMEVGTIDLQVGDVDLKTLLSEGVRDVRGLADEKNIDLQLVLPSKLESIRGDRDKLAVVLNNLLGNAIKYTPPDGNVVVGCQFTGDEAILSVKDNGIGIDPTDHARVFEKFQRANDPEVRNETGTGIGLYTAREIVRRHGGEIELISAKGQGSTFLVRLPHQETRAAALTVAEEA